MCLQKTAFKSHNEIKHTYFLQLHLPSDYLEKSSARDKEKKLPELNIEIQNHAVYG